MTTLTLADATRDYARNATPHRLLAPFPRFVFGLTGGRLGRLRLAGRRWARLTRSAYDLGYAEGAGIDRWSGRAHPSSGAITARFGHTFEQAVHTDYTTLRGRTRRSVISAAQRAPVRALAWALLVVVVVFSVDWVLNEPFVSRLADVSPLQVHIVSAGIALLLVLAGHLAVAHTPPGRVSAVRTRLVVGAVVGLAVVVGVGGLLRTQTPGSTAPTTLPIDGAGPSGWTTFWPGFVSWVSMVGLMLLTFAVSGLVSLAILSATHRLRPDGPEVARSLLVANHVDRSLRGLVEHAYALTPDLVRANYLGFAEAADPDVADRTAPYPLDDIPPEGYRPELTA